jgi:hypothetical protein
MLTHHRSKSRRCGSTACAPCHCTGLEYTRCSPESCSGVAVALLARSWTEDENRTDFSGPCPLRYGRTDMTGSGGMLQPDTRQGKRHERDEPSVGEKKLRPACAVPASWEMRMMENVFFKDGDSHVSTGSGCGCVCVARVSDGVLVRVISAHAVREQMGNLVSPSFA